MRRANIFLQYPSVITKRWLFRMTANDFSSRLQNNYTKIKGNAITKLSGIKETVDDFVGITDVQRAQISVREAENEFLKTRKRVGDVKKELDRVHNHLAELRSHLDRTPRHDEKYLALATDEHNIIREEKRLKGVYDQEESLERDQFVELSAAVRDAHERERARAERTKYWSVVGSLGGAFLGILSSTIVNYVRLKEIKNSVKVTKDSLIEKTEVVKDSVENQSQLLQAKLTEMKDTVNVFLETNVNSALVSLLNQPEQNVDSVHKVPKPDVDKISELYAEIMVNSELVRNNHSVIQTSISEVQEGLDKIQDLLQLQKGDIVGLQKLGENTSNIEDTFHKTQSVSGDTVQEKELGQSFDEAKWWIRANFISTIISLGVLVYLECFR